MGYPRFVAIRLKNKQAARFQHQSSCQRRNACFSVMASLVVMNISCWATRNACSSDKDLTECGFPVVVAQKSIRRRFLGQQAQ